MIFPMFPISLGMYQSEIATTQFTYFVVVSSLIMDLWMRIPGLGEIKVGGEVRVSEKPMKGLLFS